MFLRHPLKGRFRILKLPITFRHKKDIDNMFFTCCTIHNILHSYDGLDELEADAQWAGDYGLHEPWIADPTTDFSFVGGRGEEGHSDERT